MFRLMAAIRRLRQVKPGGSSIDLRRISLSVRFSTHDGSGQASARTRWIFVQAHRGKSQVPEVCFAGIAGWMLFCVMSGIQRDLAIPVLGSGFGKGCVIADQDTGALGHVRLSGSTSCGSLAKTVTGDTLVGLPMRSNCAHCSQPQGN
jgi:hypothetical protein